MEQTRNGQASLALPCREWPQDVCTRSRPPGFSTPCYSLACFAIARHRERHHHGSWPTDTQLRFAQRHDPRLAYETPPRCCQSIMQRIASRRIRESPSAEVAQCPRRVVDLVKQRLDPMPPRIRFHVASRGGRDAKTHDSTPLGHLGITDGDEPHEPVYLIDVTEMPNA
jgi:hypothetical protein